MANKISRNFSIVPSGHHKGAGQAKDKNVPDDSGIITFTSSLGFLYRNKEARAKTNKSGSYLLGVLNCEKGLDSVKKRLNFYGWFGKAAQNNPDKKFTDFDVTSIFLFGGKVTKYESAKLDKYITMLERHLGDENATVKNHRQSPKYKEALKEAENSQIIVTAKFDNQYFSVDDNDETRASISLGYVTFNTGKKPIVTNLEPSDSDKLVDLLIRDVEKKGDPAEKASVAFSVTRTFLKNFGGSDKDNLRMFTSSKDNAQFWSATMGSFDVSELPTDFFLNFSQEMIEEILEQDRVRFTMTFKSGQDIDKILNVDKVGDAILVVNGQINCEFDEDNKRIQFYESEPNEDGEVYKTVTFQINQGTLYTQKLL